MEKLAGWLAGCLAGWLAVCQAQTARKGLWLYSRLARFHQQPYHGIQHSARLAPPCQPPSALSALRRAPPQHALPHLHSLPHTSLGHITSPYLNSLYLTLEHLTSRHYTSRHLDIPNLTTPSHHATSLIILPLLCKMLSSLFRR